MVDNNPVPVWLRDFYEPLGNVRLMIELGNKVSGGRSYKEHFEALGIEHISVDWNGKDGALKLDIRELIPIEEVNPSGRRADMVTNIGTTEHVDPQYHVWKNIVDWIAVGGVLVSSTPLPGDWHWHGRHFPAEDWYRDFCDANGFEMEMMEVRSKAPRRCICMRALKVSEVGLVHFPDGMFINEGGRL